MQYQQHDQPCPSYACPIAESPVSNLAQQIACNTLPYDFAHLGLLTQHAQRSGKASPWLTALLKRKSPKLAAIALANKTARIAWKMMITGETYKAIAAPAALAGSAEKSTSPA